MTSNLIGRPSVDADIGQINPKRINPRLLKDISEIIDPIASTVLPKKRSGYSNTIFIIFQVCIQFLTLSPRKTAEHLECRCQEENICFQKYSVEKMKNGKRRRYFPDQPALSRFLKRIDQANCMEEFWNLVLLAHTLYLKSIDLVKTDIKAIADYTETPCVKIKEDPYCFGSKEGKTHHKTLTFSIISGDLHQVIANYKIKKRQDKLPMFEEMICTLKREGFNIVYMLIDRGFYRKRILSFLKSEGIAIIMPGRKCAQTAAKIRNYLLKKGKRYCKGFMELKYVKGVGYPTLNFDLLLVAKRKYTLQSVKTDLRTKKISIDGACKRIFPLIVCFGRNGGIKQLRGNEHHIRHLYLLRWQIEIAFREMNRLGITNKTQNRDTRLGIMGAKSLLYNIWQVQRKIVRNSETNVKTLELDEFLGNCQKHRYPLYFSI